MNPKCLACLFSAAIKKAYRKFPSLWDKIESDKSDKMDDKEPWKKNAERSFGLEFWQDESLRDFDELWKGLKAWEK